MNACPERPSEAVDDELLALSEEVVAVGLHESLP